jgi:hypothetical protein
MKTDEGARRGLSSKGLLSAGSSPMRHAGAVLFRREWNAG